QDTESRSRRHATSSSSRSNAGGHYHRRARRNRPQPPTSTDWPKGRQPMGGRLGPGYPPSPVLVLPKCSQPPPPGYPRSAGRPGYLVQGHTVFVPGTSPTLVKPASYASGYSKAVGGQQRDFREGHPAKDSSTRGAKQRTKKPKREACQRLRDAR
ncbi:unnamed protein product, partial [Ixodes hexagonus]